MLCVQKTPRKINYREKTKDRLKEVRQNPKPLEMAPTGRDVDRSQDGCRSIKEMPKRGQGRKKEKRENEKRRLERCSGKLK